MSFQTQLDKAPYRVISYRGDSIDKTEEFMNPAEALSRWEELAEKIKAPDGVAVMNGDGQMAQCTDRGLLELNNSPEQLSLLNLGYGETVMLRPRAERLIIEEIDKLEAKIAKLKKCAHVLGSYKE